MARSVAGRLAAVAFAWVLLWTPAALAGARGGVASLIVRAEQGDAQAQTQLGFLYQVGRGVPQNYAEAARWQTRAALQGVPRAQYLLGLLYDRGHGVPQDDVQAYMWLSLASASAPASWAGPSLRIRDAVATKLSPMALAKAQFLAVSFQPRPERF